MKLSPSRFPLYFILAAEFCFLLYLAKSGKIPNGHDGFQYFSLQYYFLNNFIHSGEIAQWMPYMTHGTVSNWWYYIQGSPLQAVWMLLGGILESVNFIYIFYFNSYVDLVLLICGVWGLSHKYYETREAKILVTGIAAVSFFWFDQPWWNLHLFYLIPLTLYYFLQFCDTQKGYFIFLAGSLSSLQLFGTLPYFAPVISMALFVYMFSYLCLFKEKRDSFIQGLLQNKQWLLPTIGAVLIPLVCEYLIIENGTGEVVKYNPGRKPDGSVSLDGFLGYASVGIFRWHEVFSGFSPRLDFNLYFGAFPLALVMIFAMFKPHRLAFHLWLVVFALLLFAEGTIVSKVFYYSWPEMKYFRHLVLLSPMIKLFVVFIVGYSVDRILLNTSSLGKKRALLLSSVLMTIIISSFLIYKFPVVWQIILKKTGGKLPTEYSLLDFDVISSQFFKNFIVFLGIWVIGYLFYLWEGRTYLKKYLVWAGIVLTFIDLSYYNFQHVGFRMHSLDNNQLQELKFKAMPFVQRRTHEVVELDRAKAYKEFMDPVSSDPRAQYWSNNTFLQQDLLATPLRVEHWLGPVEMLIRATRGFPNMDLTVKPPYFKEGLFRFSNKLPDMLHITGVQSDKIRLASETGRACSPEEAFEKIRESNGNSMVVMGIVDSSSSKESCEDWKSEFSGNEHSVVLVGFDKDKASSIEMLTFSANNLELKVNVPSADLKNRWLYYADAWHPFWKAYVDEKEVPVYQANLAYKAIPMEPGVHKVQFRFVSVGNNLALQVLSFYWLFLLVALVAFSWKRLERFWIAKKTGAF